MSLSPSDSNSKTRLHGDASAGLADRCTTSTTVEPSAPTAKPPGPPPKSILDDDDPILPNMNGRSSDGKKIVLVPSPVSLIVSHRHKNKNISGKQLGIGWKREIHPEGKVYFRYKNVYTDAWLYEDSTLHNLEAAVAILCRLMKVREGEDGPLPGNIEIGIHLIDKDGVKGWFGRNREDSVIQGCYHICDMEEKDCSGSMMSTPTSSGTTSITRLSEGNTFILQPRPLTGNTYLFPHHRTVSGHELNDLREKLAFWTFDAGNSKASTSPYTANELKDFSRIVGKIECFRETERRTPFLNCLSFYTAASYYVNLNHLWIGRKMSTSRWNDFVIQLQDDWYDAITPATVILAANLSFLAISSVDDSGLPHSERSLGQIVSYISLILNVANISASTILARQHRSGDHSSFEGEPPKGGPHKQQLQELERLAVIFSIPATFFWWGLLTFFISIGWICLNRTAQPTRYTVVVTIVL
ncbi:hypothetical protein DICSQDRAFT_129197 [Dichomitus squalens LYAD-421 SS1]|uniref:WW domain-containing protein n=1 Tax=Dichomitus squalens (strain LYAD-421) TaxID=732165 RepID=R7SQB7_DICSQ|nr:uncharacterized protein DICSQDRAFT_129197 [Dichomitus squalens LYAD-421 SS1]EJF57950.1 hypothetical protein DICSQDRAFT_129197 [Dichomitus squalens LYAD-421 SS1]